MLRFQEHPLHFECADPFEKSAEAPSAALPVLLAEWMFADASFIRLLGLLCSAILFVERRGYYGQWEELDGTTRFGRNIV